MELPKVTIKFYGHNPSKPFYFLSNFSAHPTVIDNLEWPTTEHYFQAMKFEGNKEMIEKVRNAKTPANAKFLGRSKSVPLRDDWEKVKIDVMKKALLAKFSQHPDIRKALVDTGDAILVEHTDKDSYWGDNGDGSGLNQLGKLLMQVRAIFQDAISNPKQTPSFDLGQKQEEKSNKRAFFEDEEEKHCCKCHDEIHFETEMKNSLKRFKLLLANESPSQEFIDSLKQAINSNSYVCENCQEDDQIIIDHDLVGALLDRLKKIDSLPSWHLKFVTKYVKFLDKVPPCICFENDILELSWNQTVYLKLKPSELISVTIFGVKPETILFHYQDESEQKDLELFLSALKFPSL